MFILLAGCAETEPGPAVLETYGTPWWVAIEDASTGDDASAPTADLVINEVRPTDDYVELYNRTDAPIALDGLRVADRADDGTPKLDEACTLEGTLEPHAFLVVVADLDSAARAGRQSDCAFELETCFEAGFGISRDGDTIFVIAPFAGIADRFDLPAGAAVLGRVPDGSEERIETLASPGAANRARGD